METVAQDAWLVILVSVLVSACAMVYARAAIKNTEILCESLDILLRRAGATVEVDTDTDGNVIDIDREEFELLIKSVEELRAENAALAEEIKKREAESE